MVSWISENIALLLEIIAVVFGVIYVVLAARNNILCWVFGIIGSTLSIWLFVAYAKLYAEAILYTYYVAAGIYGWIAWKKEDDNLNVYSHPLKHHLLIVTLGTILSIGFYFLVTNIFTDAARPMIDSFTTIFSFIATYLTTKKWIENWIYWVVIDLVTTYLYFSRGLEFYSLLMLAYSVIAVLGYIQWKKLKMIEVE